MKLRIVLALATSALAAGSLTAQTTDRSSAANRNQPVAPALAAPPARIDSATAAYDSQALRFESSWGSANIMRGAKGEVLGTVGWFRSFDVEKLVQSSPQALAAAKDFRVSNYRGSLVTSIGASLVAVGLIIAGNNSNNASTPVLIIAGAGGIGWGLTHINASYSALSRALWWYNRDVSASGSR
jgi:hypothetical protein